MEQINFHLNKDDYEFGITERFQAIHDKLIKGMAVKPGKNYVINVLVKSYMKNHKEEFNEIEN